MDAYRCLLQTWTAVWCKELFSSRRPVWIAAGIYLGRVVLLEDLSYGGVFYLFQFNRLPFFACLFWCFSPGLLLKHVRAKKKKMAHF